MGDTFVASITGLLGILAGAFLHDWFNRRGSQESRYLELRSEAYADYVNAVAMAAFFKGSDRSKVLEGLASAKNRICVFGDKEVIEALVRLEGTSLVLANEDAKQAFIDLVRVIRSHGIARGLVSDTDINIALFGAEPPNLTVQSPQPAAPNSVHK